MTDEERERLRSEREKIEREMVRDALRDQPGWLTRLDSASDWVRKEVMRMWLSQPLFERWCVITDALS